MTNETIKALLLQMYKRGFNVERHVNIYDTDKQHFTHYIDFEYSLGEGDIIVEIGAEFHGTIYKDTEPDYDYNPIGDGRAGENQSSGVFIKRWEMNKIEVFRNDVLTDIKITVEDLQNIPKICEN